MSHYFTGSPRDDLTADRPKQGHFVAELRCHHAERDDYYSARLEDHLVEEFARLTVISREKETQAEFNKRLIDYWTHMLRGWPEEYKRVYAETAHFEPQADRFARHYFMGCEICELLQRELSISQIDFEPIDEADLYSKYEAASPEWFQIPH